MMKYLFFSIICCSLSSCNLRSAGYRFADLYLENRADHYFDLNREQSERAEALADDTLNQVNKSVFPFLISDLQTLSSKTQSGPFGLAEAQWVQQRYQETLWRFYDGAATPLAGLLSTLSKDQVNYFAAVLQKESRERHDKLKLSEADFQKQQLKQVTSRFEKFFGSFSREQEQRFAEIFLISRQQAEISYKIRDAMNEAVVSFLHSSPNPDAIAIQAKRWANDRSTMIADTDLRRIYIDRQKQIPERMTAAFQVLTPEQRAHFLKELAALRTDLVVMSQRRF